MRKIKSFIWISIGLAALAVGFAPATRVPIMGDDLFILYESQAMSHANFWEWTGQAWGLGLQAGHFNPVGQFLGGVFHFIALPLSSALSIGPQYYYQFGAFTLLLLAVMSGTFFFVASRKTLDRDYPRNSFPRAFSLIALITGVTLQVHPWSNDPVTTYSMAGFGGTALGFLFLGFCMQSIRSSTKPWHAYLPVGITAMFGVVYYELLIAAVAAGALIFVTALIPSTRVQTISVKRGIGLGVVGVVVPSALFAVGRLYVALIGGTGGYTGTDVSVGIPGFKTLLYALISSIPGGAWPYTLYKVNPILFSRAALIGGALITLVLVIFWIIWWREKETRTDFKPKKLWIPMASIVIFWVLSTAAQAFAAKYTLEISAPGLVYLFYSTGLISVSLIFAGIFSFIPKAHLFLLGGVLLPLVVWFSINQQAINWTLGDQMSSSYALNRELAIASTNGHIAEEKRCEVLEKWANTPPWPEYYRNGIVSNLKYSYLQISGEEFCNDASIPGKGARK